MGSSYCIQKVTTCFTSASVAIRINGQVLLTGSKQIVIIGCEVGTVERAVHNLPAIAPVSETVVSISLDTIRGNWVTCDLQQMPAGSKLSLHSRRHLTPISSTAGEKPYCHSGTYAYMLMVTRWKSDVYHLLLMCYV
jgi:copper chaperone CopZ